MILSKKNRTWLAAFMLIFSLLLISVARAEETEVYVSGDYAYKVSAEGAIITNYLGVASILTVPDTLGGYRVIGIEERAFWSWSISITEITLPEGLTSIGERAFSECRSLTAITLPEGLMSIGDYAFSECGSLTAITLPEGLTSIGDCAFEMCESLTAVTLPDSLTSIGGNPFINSPVKITLSPIHSRFSIIDGVLFDRVEGILLSYPYGSHADSYSIPRGISAIGDYAFFNCGGLTAITLPEGLTSIGERAFSGCDSLTDLTLLEGLTSIGDYAFSGCDSLTDLTLPDSLTSIGGNPFEDTPVSITLSPDNPRFALIDGALFDKAEKKLIAYPFGSLADAYNVPQGIRVIGEDAFFNCESLTAITLPEGLTSIGGGAFFGCTNLTAITLPEGIMSIEAGAFFKCESLTTITLPEGLMSIEQSTFAFCTRLDSITIPTSITDIKVDPFELKLCSAVLTLTVTRDSYAARWAKENGIPYTYLDALDWLSDGDKTEKMYAGSAPVDTGGVTGSVVWHNTTEAQPDEGAYVALLPLDFEEGEADFIDFSAQDEYPEGFGGIYTTRADAAGKYSFGAVKPGEYMVFMVSYSCLLDEEISDEAFRGMFSFLPDEVPEAFLTTVGPSKFLLEHIQVEKGKTAVFDHDFGNTY